MAGFPVSSEMKNGVEEVMARGMEMADLFVNKNYLIDIDGCAPVPLDEGEKIFSAMSLFRLIRLFMIETRISMISW